MTRTHIGVDLSKDWLDIHHPRAGDARIANRKADLAAWLDGLDSDDIVVFEATSLCDGLIRRMAGERSQPVHRLNPRHCWRFGSSLNLAKTDRIDARMLARIGAERGLGPSPGFDAARAELAELVGRRDQLKRMQTQEKNRLARTWSAAVAEDIRIVLASLAARIVEADRRIRGFFREHPDLAEAQRLLSTIPGIGPVAGAALLAHMPELGSLDRRRIASLAGLAPRARESGTWRGRRHTGDGRRQPRRALYMAALSAMRKTSPLLPAADRLRARGKPGKVIAIALARKILTIANAVLRDRRPFQPTANRT